MKPAWAVWSPVGWALGQAMLAAGMSEGALRATHLGTWLFHAVIALGFIAVSTSLEEAGAILKRDSAKWTKVIQAAGIKAE